MVTVPMVPFAHGQCVAWDVTVRDTYAPGYRETVSRRVGGLAVQAEHLKRNKYRGLVDYAFVPFAIETSGYWVEEASRLVRQLGKRIAQRTQEPRATVFLRQRISLALQRGNARAVLASQPKNTRPLEVAML
jgi:hypothetical protein